jgi:hypothetical protein
MEAKDELATIQINKAYVALLKKVAKSKTPRTSMRAMSDSWILSEAKKAGLL